MAISLNNAIGYVMACQSSLVDSVNHDLQQLTNWVNNLIRTRNISLRSETEIRLDWEESEFKDDPYALKNSAKNRIETTLKSSASPGSKAPIDNQKTLSLLHTISQPNTKRTIASEILAILVELKEQIEKRNKLDQIFASLDNNIHACKKRNLTCNQGLGLVIKISRNILSRLESLSIDQFFNYLKSEKQSFQYIGLMKLIAQFKKSGESKNKALEICKPELNFIIDLAINSDFNLIQQLAFELSVRIVNESLSIDEAKVIYSERADALTSLLEQLRQANWFDNGLFRKVNSLNASLKRKSESC